MKYTGVKDFEEGKLYYMKVLSGEFKGRDRLICKHPTRIDTGLNLYLYDDKGVGFGHPNEYLKWEFRDATGEEIDKFNKAQDKIQICSSRVDNLEIF